VPQIQRATFCLAVTLIHEVCHSLSSFCFGPLHESVGEMYDEPFFQDESVSEVGHAIVAWLLGDVPEWSDRDSGLEIASWPSLEFVDADDEELGVTVPPSVRGPCAPFSCSWAADAEQVERFFKGAFWRREGPLRLRGGGGDALLSQLGWENEDDDKAPLLMPPPPPPMEDEVFELLRAFHTGDVAQALRADARVKREGSEA